MTEEETKILREMTVADRIRKYLPFLNEKKITQQQYDYVINLKDGSVATKEVTPEEFTEAFVRVGTATEEYGGQDSISEGLRQDISEPVSLSKSVPTTTHTNKSDGRSQKARLIDLLSDQREHNTVEIMEKVYRIDGEKAGNCRIPSRICDLRKEGYIIPKAKHIKGGIYSYILKGKQATPYQVEDKTEQIINNLASG